MGVKLNSVTIALDSRSNVFIPGQNISGQCVISLNGRMDLSQLSIKLKGKAECKWKEKYTEYYTDSNGERQSRSETKTIYSVEYVVNMEYSPGKIDPGILGPGQPQIPFGFQLPKNIPSSFEGEYGHIRYYLKVHIHKTSLFSFDVREVFNIYVRAPALATIQELRRSVESSNETFVGFCCWGKPLSLDCRLNNVGQNIGSSSSVLCSIDNRSEESMQLKADLKQYVTFKAQGKRKYTSQTLVNVRGTIIQPQSQQTEALSLPIPSSAPVVHNSCKIIEISYVIRIMLSDHLKCKLPIILTQNLSIDS